MLTADAVRQLPDIAVAEREQYLTMAVRDFLNEGGKLVHMGEMAQDSGGRARPDSSAARTTASTATRTRSA